MKRVFTVLILAAVAAGVFALGSLRMGTDGKALLHVADEVALTVKVASPEQGEIIRLVQSPGDVEAVLEVEISSEIVSKIIEMPVEEGETVLQGDLLCRLDDKNLLAEIESAEARIAQLSAGVVQAEAELEKADRDYRRQLNLSESYATSDLELRDYRTQKKAATAILEMRKHERSQAQAMLKRIHENLKKTVIRSPIAGVISKLNAKQGEVVVTGTMNNPGTVIMSISDLSKMQVRTRVDEVDIPLVKPGQKGRVYLQSEPDKPVPARVVRVASKGTRALGRDLVTFEALLEVLSNDERIKPGMTANVEIEVARCDDAIAVPVEAVVHRMRKDLPDSIVAEFDRKQAERDLSERARQGQYIKVLYVMNDDVAQVRLIEPGIADTRRVEIRQGVEMEDLVIVGPYRSLDQLKDGKKIALAEGEKPKPKETETDGESNEEQLAGEEKDKGQDKKSEAEDESPTVASRTGP